MHPVCVRSGNEWRIRARDHFRRLRRLTPHSHGASLSTPLVDFEWSDVKRCRTELWVRRVTSLALLAAEVENFSSANGGVSQSDRLMQISNPVHATPEKYVIGCCNYDGASAPRFRHALRQALTPMPRVMQREPERVHTHVTHRMRVRTHFTWTWLCTRGKKDINYCSFSHTNSSFRVLGHQCVVTMGNCLIWISLCMFFFPLIETVTYTCHYMTDRLERFDPKNIKIGSTEEKKTLHLGCPWGKLIDTKF